MSKHIRRTPIALALTVILATSTAHVAHAQAATNYDLPAQPLADSIKAVANQSNTNVLFDKKLVAGLEAPPLKAQLTPEAAIARLLEGTSLRHELVNEHTIVLAADPTKTAASSGGKRPGRATSDSSSRAQRAVDPAAAPDTSDSRTPGQRLWLAQSGNVETPGGAEPTQMVGDSEPIKGVPEVLVQGSKILNMDLQRSRDDTQPYVIFNRETIESSGAANLEDFLKQRLTMNTVAGSNAQATGVRGVSQINLRGLGTNQTLILVDGQRLAQVYFQGGPNQPDINGIPLAAIERIEVLPTTASGIYGGGATGGAINIIRRRDYSGGEVQLGYDNTFDADSAARRIDASYGTNFEEGKTNLLLAATLADARPLLQQDRTFLVDGRAAIRVNNPAFLTNSATPPLGAAVNIRSVSGAPLFGPGTPSFTSVPVGYGGGGGIAPLQANAGQYNLDLADSAQANGGGRATLLGGSRIQSFNATLRRAFSDRVQAYLDAAVSDNEQRLSYSGVASGFTIASTAPNNPFGQPIRVTVPLATGDGLTVTHNKSRRLDGGLIAQLPASWMLMASYAWNDTRNTFDSGAVLSAAGTNAIANGAIDVLRDVTVSPVDVSAFLTPGLHSLTPLKATLKDASMRAAGPVFMLPAGAVTLAALVEYRDEQFAEGAIYVNASTSTQYPSRSQSTWSAYLESNAPLISASNRHAGLEALSLQLAVRHDRYHVNGVTGQTPLGASLPITRATTESQSTDPTVGLRYQPWKDLTLRASYGTGFLPPTVSQLVPNAPINNANTRALDPRRGNEAVGTVVALAGGDPNLRPETSTSRSIGAIFTPRWAPGLRMSVDYLDIRKKDNIANLSYQTQIDNEAILPGRITRGPVPPGDPFGVGPIIGINIAPVNIARAEVESYDVALDYEYKTASAGSFDLFSGATIMEHSRTQLAPDQPVIENVGVPQFATIYDTGIPVKVRANAGLTWRQAAWTLGWSARYFSSYRAGAPGVATTAVNLLNQGNGGSIPHQIYHDLFASYRVSDGSGDAGASARRFLGGTVIGLGIRNVLNTPPPLDTSILSANLYSYLSDPRLRSYSLTVKHDF